MQISCLEEILESWLPDLVKDPVGPVFGKIDLTTILMTGHSRGAKLATLHFAGSQTKSSLFLLCCLAMLLRDDDQGSLNS